MESANSFLNHAALRGEIVRQFERNTKNKEALGKSVNHYKKDMKCKK
jgi:hypothetical protein